MMFHCARKAGPIWQRVAACLLVAHLLIAIPGGWGPSVAADEGTPSSEINEVEPTVEQTEEPVVTEETEVVPVETLMPTELPMPTETVPPTVRPINTDTIVPDGDFTAIALQSGIDTATTVSFTYQVTTPRQGTRLVVELRDASGAPASGWTLSLPSLGAEGAGSVSALESSTSSAGESFSLPITIVPPADVEVAESFSLHVWSTGLLDDGSEENAVADAGALAGITILPLPPTPTETPTVAPTTPATPASAPATPIAPQVITDEFTGSAVVNGGDITCTPNGTSTISISGTDYFAASFACSDTIIALPANYTAVTTGPWKVRFNNNVPGNPGTTATLSGLAVGLFSFTVTLLTPVGTANGTTGSATVRQGSNTVTTISSTKSTIQNGGASNLYNFECSDPVPVSQTIAQGGSLSFTCTFWGLATADVNGLAALHPTLKLTAPGGVGSFMVGGQPYASGVTIDVKGLLDAHVLTSTSIPITYLAPCNAATGSIGAQSTLDLSVLGIGLSLSTFNSTVPVTVTSATLVAPALSITSGTTVDFTTSEWNGTSYPAKASSLTFSVSPPSPGCGNATWYVTASASAMTSGNHSIGGDRITFTLSRSGGSDGGITAPSGSLGTTQTVISGSSAVAGTNSFTLGLTLTPPTNAPPGHYQGTITIESTTTTGP